jgi:hypothetical protein
MRHLILTLPFLVTLGGCFQKSMPDESPECIADAQCGEGQICDYQICVDVEDTGGKADEGADDEAEDEGDGSTSGPSSASASASDDGTTTASTTAGGESASASTTASTTGPEDPVCSDVGYECSVNGDCCEFPDTASCVSFQEGSFCSAKCWANEECASGCCQPLTTNGTPAGYGACAPDNYCGVSTCGLAECLYNYCGGPAEGNCPIDWFGDGECDCGCQFNDIDC